MKRVLVTGARGFIGRHCLRPLLASGYEVHAVSSQRAVSSQASSVAWHHLDLMDFSACDALMTKLEPSHLLHLAWVTAPGEYPTSPANLRWVQASLQLLRAFRDCSGERVVMAGTCAEYDWTQGFCSERDTPLAPKGLYGVCKHALQMMMSAYAAQTGMSSAWGRVFFPYGPGEPAAKLTASVVRALLARQPVACSEGAQQRDYIYVEDAAEAFVALLDGAATGPVNIGTGETVSVRAIVTAIAEALGRPDLPQFGALGSAASEAPLVVADVMRLNEEVHFYPKTDLASGVGLTIDSWRRELAGAAS